MVFGRNKRLIRRDFFVEDNTGGSDVLHPIIAIRLVGI